MQIADAHNDLLMSFDTHKQVNKYINFCKDNKVVKLLTAYYVSQKQENLNSSQIFEDIEHKFSLVNGLGLALRSFENIGFVKNYADLNRLIVFKPFCATLTWNYANCLAGGALSSGGITNWGMCVIKNLQENDILIDTAHLNEKSFYQYVDNFCLPLFCSHTASKKIYPIERNLNNNQLELISKSHGFVGLCLYNKLLGEGKSNFEVVHKHLDVFLEFAGADAVGFGTDFNGTGEENPIGIRYDYLGMYDLYEYLLKFYSNEIVDKIFYQNLLNFISSRQKVGT